MSEIKKIFSLLVLALLLAACGEEDYLYKKIGQDFDNSGGTYKGVNGVTVHIEPGSLPEGTDVVTITAYALDTPAFTNVSKPVTNIYSISPAAFEFAKNLYYEELKIKFIYVIIIMVK